MPARACCTMDTSLSANSLISRSSAFLASRFFGAFARNARAGAGLGLWPLSSSPLPTRVSTNGISLLCRFATLQRATLPLTHSAPCLRKAWFGSLQRGDRIRYMTPARPARARPVKGHSPSASTHASSSRRNFVTKGPQLRLRSKIRFPHLRNPRPSSRRSRSRRPSRFDRCRLAPVPAIRSLS